MHTSTNQRTVDQKIHRFIESKSRRSSWQLLKDVIAEQFTTPHIDHHEQSGDMISYETIAWTNNSMRKAAGRYKKNMAS